MEPLLTYVETQIILEWPEFADAKEELNDPRFISLAHDISTYHRGCRGPICKMANRNHIRNWTAKKMGEQGEEYRPPKYSKAARFDEIYETMKYWHKAWIINERKRHEEAS